MRFPFFKKRDKTQKAQSKSGPKVPSTHSQTQREALSATSEVHQVGQEASSPRQEISSTQSETAGAPLEAQSAQHEQLPSEELEASIAQRVALSTTQAASSEQLQTPSAHQEPLSAPQASSSVQVLARTVQWKAPSTPLDRPIIGATAKGALTMTLETAQIALSAFPVPVAQLVIGSVLQIIKSFDTLDQNNDGFRDLDRLLKSLTDSILSTLSGKDKVDISPNCQEQLRILTSHLEEIALQSRKASSHGLISRFFGADKEKDTLDGLVKEIGNALACFNLGSSLNEDAHNVRINGVLASIVDIIKAHRSEDQRHAEYECVDKLPRAIDAPFDSGLAGAHVTCLAGTREAILDAVHLWINDTTPQVQRIFWMNGMAGTGKSTIAKTVAHRAKEAYRLGASYFIRRNDPNLQDPRRIIPTIAYQLAQWDENFKSLLAKTLDCYSDISAKTLEVQFDALFLEPVLEWHKSPLAGPFVIVVDALDECEKPVGDGETFLSLLVKSTSRLPPSVKVFVTSRPEGPIHNILNSDSFCRILQLEDELYDVDVRKDIRLYLETRLAGKDTKLDWSSNPITATEMDELVNRSGNLFVYAATVLRFISDDQVGNPRVQLDILLDQQKVSDASPFSYLDLLYLNILKQTLSAMNPSYTRDRFQSVIGTIVLVRKPLPMKALDRISGSTSGDSERTLKSVRSLILMPPTDDQAPLIYHKSMPDFILDPLRCTDKRFLIVKAFHERRIALRCLELLNTLKRDMLDIKDPSLLNQDVVDLEHRIATVIPPELAYACMFWSSHLVTTSPSQKTEYFSEKDLSERIEELDRELTEELKVFTDKHLLHWVEVMSLLGFVSEAIACVLATKSWAASSSYPLYVTSLLDDTYRFLVNHYEAISTSSLHVYHSALPFVPRETLLYKQYDHELKNSVSLIRGIDPVWPPHLCTLSPAATRVESIAFSSKSSMIAATTYDKMLEDSGIHIWHSPSFVYLRTLCNPDMDMVLSVSFSPSGKQIASGCLYGKICIWDASDGALLRILERHQDDVNCVVYSCTPANRELLASCSDDTTVLLWDTATWTVIFMLVDHTDKVKSVAFCNDGTRLASGSWDDSIRIWDVDSGECLWVITGNNDYIIESEFAWSPDGIYIACAGRTKSPSVAFIHVWNTLSRAGVCTFHPKATESSSFVVTILWSDDGKLLVSAFARTKAPIHIWDVSSAVLLAQLSHSSQEVRGIAFLSNGIIASGGSDDVRLWDITHLPIPHSEWTDMADVNSSAASVDGRWFISGSFFGEVRLWDVESGEPLSSRVPSDNKTTCVALSKDARQVAIFSNCHSHGQIWDTAFNDLVALKIHHSDYYESRFSRVNCAVFSPDGSRIAISASKILMAVFEVSSGASVLEWRGHGAAVKCMVWSNDGKFLVSGSSDSSIIVWDIASGSQVTILPHLPGPIVSVALTPDELYLTAIADLNPHEEEWEIGSDMPWWEKLIPQTKRLAWEFTSLRSGSESPSPREAVVPFCNDPQSLSRNVIEINDNWLWAQTDDEHWIRVCRIPPEYSVITKSVTSNRQFLGCKQGQVLIMDISRCHVFERFDQWKF